MKACNGARTTRLSVKPLSSAPRRWRSYDKATLTEEALLGKLEEGLGDGPDSPRIDPTTKRVKTAVGELPVSPLFDPTWIASRRRKSKEPNKKPSGRFRSKVYNNPYARALETPMRFCSGAKQRLPRYFLQDFEVIRHPESGKPWWAPGPISFYHLENDKQVAELKRKEALLKDGSFSSSDESNTAQSMREDDANQTPTASVDPPAARAIDHMVDNDNDISGKAEDAEETAKPVLRKESLWPGMPTRAPLVSYGSCKKHVLSGWTARKLPISGLRSGMAIDESLRNAFWRGDMAVFLERMLRRHAVDALVRRAARTEDQDSYRFIEPCKGWEDVKNIRLRGCVLWLPASNVEVTAYPTLDVEAQYGSKVAVYNLPWLLGEEEVTRLKEQAPMFRDTELLVLKQWPTWSVRSLHMLLWRLQGFLTTP